MAGRRARAPKCSRDLSSAGSASPRGAGGSARRGRRSESTRSRRESRRSPGAAQATPDPGRRRSRRCAARARATVPAAASATAGAPSSRTKAWRALMCGCTVSRPGRSIGETIWRRLALLEPDRHLRGVGVDGSRDRELEPVSCPLRARAGVRGRGSRSWCPGAGSSPSPRPQPPSGRRAAARVAPRPARWRPGRRRPPAARRASGQPELRSPEAGRQAEGSLALVGTVEGAGKRPALPVAGAESSAAVAGKGRDSCQ